MPYCTQADLLEQIEESELVQITDDADAGALDDSVVARAIADADAEIDSYCAARYTLPFALVPAMIRKVAVDIAIYNLCSRRGRNVLDTRKARYDNAVRFLKSVSAGDVSLGADDPAPPVQGHAPQFAGNDRVFTRNKMSGF